MKKENSEKTKKLKYYQKDTMLYIKMKKKINFNYG
jgi:hypothetical protein